MVLAPLRVKKRERPRAADGLDDGQGVPVRQKGPTIPGPVSVEIPEFHAEHASERSEWYFKGPPDPSSEDGIEALPFGIRYTVQNIVCTVNLGCKVDVSEIPKKTQNAEYNPQRFSACIMRIRKPKSTALIFQSGKVVIAGTTSSKDCEEAAKVFAEIINKIGYNITLQNLKIQNVVANCNVKFPIRLEALSSFLSEQAEKKSTCGLFQGMSVQYEPELFPGLVMKKENPHMCFLIFGTGKLVCTGLKDKTEKEHQPWLSLQEMA